MDQLPALLREDFVNARAKAIGKKQHLRIPEALAHLWLGLDLALRYALEIGAIGKKEESELRNDCWRAFVEIGRQQSMILDEERPTLRFLRVLHTLLTQERAIVCDKDKDTPEPKAGVEFIGWRDIEFLYLLPEAVYGAVVKFCRDSAEGFPIRLDRLKRDLAKERISKVDGGRLTTTVAVSKHTKRVLQPPSNRSSASRASVMSARSARSSMISATGDESPDEITGQSPLHHH